MIEVHVDKRWDVLQTHVYVIDRTKDAIYAYDSYGRLMESFSPGQYFMDQIEPTYVIIDQFLDEIVKALSPDEPKVDKFIVNTVEYERSIIDRLLK